MSKVTPKPSAPPVPSVAPLDMTTKDVPPMPPTGVAADKKVAPPPGDAMTGDRGARTSFALPGQPGANAAPVPQYGPTFGNQSYVKDGKDANLMGLMRRAVSQSPELASGPLGEAVKNGQVGPEHVKALQKHLKDKGFDVGHTGVDGKYGPLTHGALAKFLGGEKPGATPEKPADGTKPEEGTTPEKPADGTPAKPGDKLDGTMEQDGLRIPNNGEGRATTFWNGHMAYKGKYDMNNRQNNGIGAWGDKCDPKEYFVALPVKDKRWHNQKILITNPETGKQVVARVQDKGPHPSTGAKIDLSPVTMEALGGNFKGDLRNVQFRFAPPDAKVGPVG